MGWEITQPRELDSIGFTLNWLKPEARVLPSTLTHGSVECSRTGPTSTHISQGTGLTPAYRYLCTGPTPTYCTAPTPSTTNLFVPDRQDSLQDSPGFHNLRSVLLQLVKKSVKSSDFMFREKVWICLIKCS